MVTGKGIYDPSVPNIINKPFPNSDYYFVLITTKSTRIEDTLIFHNTGTNNSRILASAMFNSTSGDAQIPAFSVSSVEDVTFHYFKVKHEGDRPSPLPATVMGSRTRLWDFPSSEDTFQERKMKFSDLTYGFEYESHVYSFFVRHEHNTDLFCNFNLKFTGSIRAIYINDNYIGNFISQKSSPTSTDSDTIISGHPVYLKSRELHLITVFGYRLRLTDFLFTTCEQSYPNSGAILTVPIIYYTMYPEPPAPSETYTLSTITASCEANAIKCIDETHSLKCAEPYFRYNMRCVLSCSNATIQYHSSGERLCVPIYYPKMFIDTINPSNEQIDIKLGIDAPINTYMVTFIGSYYGHTFGLTTIPWFPTAEGINTLPEAILRLDKFIGSPINLSTNLSLCAGAANLYVYTAPVIEDSMKSMMIEIYNIGSAPEASDAVGKVDIQTFFYARHNDIITWDGSYFARIQTYVQCNYTCFISFHAKGQVKLYKNQRTLLLDLDMGSSSWTLNLHQRIGGLNMLTFEITGGGIFSLTVTGLEYRVFALDFQHGAWDITPELVNEGEPCDNPNAINHLNGVDYSCQDGYFLNGTSCVSSCGERYQYFPERLCVDCCSGSLLAANTTHCTVKCQPGKYFIPGVGCSGTCMAGCIECTDSTTCLKCASVAFLNQLGSCSMNSYLNILGNPMASSCSDIILSAEIDPAEESSYSINYTWSVISNSTNMTLTSSLNEYLASQSTKGLYIPSSYLEPNVSYKFTCSYKNLVNADISNILIVETIPDNAPAIKIDGDLNRIVQRYEDVIIEGEIFYSTCNPLNENVRVLWTQLTGPTLNLDNYVDPKMPLWIKIPKCTLAGGTSYKIEARAYIDPYSSDITSIITSLDVQPEKFTAEIVNAFRDHSYINELELLANYKFDGQCPDTDTTGFEYQWKCQVAANEDSLFSPCPDPDGFFNTYTSYGLLILPTYYFQLGNVLEITLLVRKGSTVSYAFGRIKIVEADELLIRIDCVKGPCKKYTFREDLVLNGSIVDEEYDPAFEYRWEIIGSDLPLFTAQFRNSFKLFADHSLYTRTTKSSIRLALSIVNGPLSGKTYLRIPINTPPSSGTISVSPGMGTALETKFFICSTGWIDEDIPLSYQYFYSRDEQNWSVLTDVQLIPYTYTFLSGATSNSIVYLKVVVTDCYGSKSDATTIAQVFPTLTTIEALLSLGYTTLGSLSNSDYFANIQLLGMLASQIADWEANNAPPIITSCSEHGTCPAWNATACICDKGWTLDDCSMTQSDFDSLLNLKLEVIAMMDAMYTQIKNSDKKQFYLDFLQTLSHSSVFNSNATLAKIQARLEDITSMNDDNKILSNEEIIAAVTILSNSYEVARQYDCSCSTDFCHKLEQKSYVWLTKVSTSTLSYTIPDNSPLTIETDIFNAIQAKATACGIEYIYFQGSGAPTLQLDAEESLYPDCDRSIVVYYYTFQRKSDIFNCDDTRNISANKEFIMIDIFDEATGEDLSHSFRARLYMPDGVTCLDGCYSRDGCYCSDLSKFSVKKQLNTMFPEDTPFTLEALNLLAWAFFNSPVVWSMFGFVGWLIISFVLVKTCFKNTCSFKAYQRKKKKPFCYSLKTGLIISHPLLNIYFYKNDELRKTTRVILYYIRIVIYGAFSAIFAEGNEDKVRIS